MRNVRKAAFGSQERSELRRHEDDRLSAADWQWCIEDDCASWQLPCQVYINARCPEDAFPRVILIRIQYVGQSASFDAQSWTGLIETVEHEFTVAGYQSRMSCANGSEATMAWKQWVIVPDAAWLMKRINS